MEHTDALLMMHSIGPIDAYRLLNFCQDILATLSNQHSLHIYFCSERSLGTLTMSILCIVINMSLIDQL